MNVPHTFKLIRVHTCLGRYRCSLLLEVKCASWLHGGRHPGESSGGTVLSLLARRSSGIDGDGQVKRKVALISPQSSLASSLCPPGHRQVASFLHRELPIRLAHRVRDLESVPDMLAQKSVRQVKEKSASSAPCCCYHCTTYVLLAGTSGHRDTFFASQCAPV